MSVIRAVTRASRVCCHSARRSMIWDNLCRTISTTVLSTNTTTPNGRSITARTIVQKIAPTSALIPTGTTSMMSTACTTSSPTTVGNSWRGRLSASAGCPPWLTTCEAMLARRSQTFRADVACSIRNPVCQLRETVASVAPKAAIPPTNCHTLSLAIRL